MSGDTARSGLNPAALRLENAAKVLGISVDVFRYEPDTP